jgi:hypothetical protein
MVLGAALCCAGCEKPVAAPSADASPSVGSAAVTAQLGSSPLPGNPADRLKALAMLHRVPADVRFLDAYRDVHLLLAGTPIERPTATFDGEWILRSGNVEVGRAPDIPDFSDLMKALIGYVRGLEAKGKLPAGLDATPVAGSSLDFPMDDEVDAMLTRAAASWPKRAGESLELALDALIPLTFQTVDTLEVGDALAARAIALYAIEAALVAGDHSRHEAMLARALDYRRAARAAAARLPSGDAVKAFVERDDAVLGPRAKRPDATPWTKYLWLRRLIGRGAAHEAGATSGRGGPKLLAREPYTARLPPRNPRQTTLRREGERLARRRGRARRGARRARSERDRLRRPGARRDVALRSSVDRHHAHRLLRLQVEVDARLVEGHARELGGLALGRRVGRSTARDGHQEQRGDHEGQIAESTRHPRATFRRVAQCGTESYIRNPLPSVARGAA